MTVRVAIKNDGNNVDSECLGSGVDVGVVECWVWSVGVE